MTSVTKKARNQSPLVAKRKMLRSVMKRANAIAKNALNTHNTSIQRIGEHGASASVKEFLPMAIQMAWKEQRTGQTVYEMTQGLPRKTMPQINQALALKVAQTNADSDLTQADRHYYQAKTMLLVRSAGEPTEDELNQASSYAYGHALNETFALSA